MTILGPLDCPLGNHRDPPHTRGVLASARDMRGVQVWGMSVPATPSWVTRSQSVRNLVDSHVRDRHLTPRSLDASRVGTAKWEAGAGKWEAGVDRPLRNHRVGPFQTWKLRPGTAADSGCAECPVCDDFSPLPLTIGSIGTVTTIRLGIIITIGSISRSSQSSQSLQTEQQIVLFHLTIGTTLTIGSSRLFVVHRNCETMKTMVENRTLEKTHAGAGGSGCDGCVDCARCMDFP